MRRLCLAFLVVLSSFTLFTVAQAAWVEVGDGEGFNATLLESSPNRIAVEFTLGGFEQTLVSIDGRDYAQIGLPGEALTLEEGLPELPLSARSVIIPNDRMTKLRVVSSEYVDLQGVDPIPSKGNLPRTIDPASVPYTFGAFYSSDGWYPGSPASVREPYILRDYRGQTLVANMIQYQPSTHTLRVYTRLVVELLDAGFGGPNTLQTTPRALEQGFSDIYREHFLNFENGERYSMVPEVGSMLVIVYDDFASAMQPFVDWKNRMGVPTQLVLKSAVGTTAAQITSYIQGAYNASSDPRLAFVLLVGDAAQIPTPSAHGGSADPLYSKVAGSDNYPDIFIGRFSAETLAQVQTQVERTLQYEGEPMLGGTAWYPRGVGIASNQGPGDDGEYDYQHIDRIRGLLMAYGHNRVDQIYDPNATAAMVTNAVNEGRSIMNYCGHGSTNAWSTTGFSSSNVSQLQNAHMLPFIFSVACVNGQFANGSCFAEAWLRSTRNGTAIGAIATYMSSVNQSWNPPMCAQDECDRLIVTDAARTFGSICYHGSCQMMDEYYTAGVSEFDNWHVFGDPSVRIRTKAPVALTVTHAEYLDPTATTFAVDVQGASSVLCGLSYQGMYLGSAFADAGGHAEITIVGTLPEGEVVEVAVTGYNAVPHFGQVEVVPPALPIAILNPTSFDFYMLPGSQVEYHLQVSNMGDPASIMNFQAHFAPGMSGLLTNVTPSEGTLLYGESADLTLTIDSGDILYGTYTAYLHVAYNPHEEAVIPVTAHVEDPADAPVRGSTPLQVELVAGQPNPFTDGTVLRYGLPGASAVRLAIFDASGRMVRLLADGEAAAGYHPVAWNGMDEDGRPVATGVYFARLEAAGITLNGRLLRIR